MASPPLGITARATVHRVVDGDTLDVHLLIPVRVRMLDCWAPEITGAQKPEGKASKLALEELAPVGSHVVVNVPTGHVDAMAGVLTFGRVLGNVYKPGEESSLSELMVGMGFATKEKP